VSVHHGELLVYIMYYESHCIEIVMNLRAGACIGFPLAVVNTAFAWTAFLKLDEASGALIVDPECCSALV